MFSFDQQANWLITNLEALDPRDYILLEISDTRTVPKCKLNPSLSCSLDTKDRLGFFGIWENGLFDYIVMEANSEKELANYAGLEATDQTVSRHFLDFLDLLQIDPA